MSAKPDDYLVKRAETLAKAIADIVHILPELNGEERLAVFKQITFHYCRHCGKWKPLVGRNCRCNDDS